MLPNSSSQRHKTALSTAFKSLILKSDWAIDDAPAHQLRLWLDRVKRELTRERNKGKMRHYRYDMNRHIALAAARNEIAERLDQLEAK